MKLFRRRNPPPNSDEAATPPSSGAPPLEPPPPTEGPAAEVPRKIELSEEQKSILEKPIDPRVARIMNEIYADREAAERALKSAHRIIEFPIGDSGERHVTQDENGFWRIVPGAPPDKPISMIEAL